MRIDMDVNKLIEMVKQVENYREYTPKEDMFGVGYDQAKEDIIKLIKDLEEEL
jgi:hypothetical protein